MTEVLSFVAQWEWLLLLSVAALEAVILRQIYQERRERSALIAEMKSTRAELGRESYLAMIKDTLAAATNEVYFVSHSLTAGMSMREKESIFSLYRKGRDHRCIVARDPGKLREMWEQHRQGVQLRVNDVVMRSTFRYQVCDGRVVVLGFSGGGDEASRKGICVENAFFAGVLRQHFLSSWALSQPFLKYVKEVLMEHKSPEVPPSLAAISAEWALLETEEALVRGYLGIPPNDTSGASADEV